MDIEHITAAAFLDAAARSHGGVRETSSFRHMTTALKCSPKAQQRLAFELLPIACNAMEGTSDRYCASAQSTWVLGFTRCFSESIEPRRLPEYAAWLERIIFRCFELLEPAERPGGTVPFEFTLELACDELKRVDMGRLRAVMEAMKTRWLGPENAFRQHILDRMQGDHA